ncbi:trypsin-like peptidase domain-containing protein [Streptomyces sp. NPDC012600]|uniref:trypsin-like peptidase domain-containing protein n=1 Tax=Streptomyces sp. NPDC012600 TaxID=3415005 RepID=UPI003C2EBDB4
MFRVLRAAGLAALLTAMSLAAAPSAGAETRTADSRTADSRPADSHLTGARPADSHLTGARTAETRTAVGGGTGIVFRLTPTPEQPTGLYICSLTAVGRDAGGNLVALTNAHCFIDEQGRKLVGEKVYRDESPPGTAFAPAPIPDSRPDLKTGVIGEVTHVSTPNNLLNSGPKGLDYAVIKLDESVVVPTNTVNGTTITSIGAPPANGTRMCKQGHRTGLTCGIKLGTSGIWFTHLIWTNGGDSGAPVVVGSTLVGNAWGAQHSSSILDIIGELDANGGVGAGFHLVT